MKFEQKEGLEKYIEKDVIFFLKENNVYNKFLFNLKTWINNKYDNSLCWIPININSFNWSNTEEKHNYWSHLDWIYMNEKYTITKTRKTIRFKELKDLIK